MTDNTVTEAPVETVTLENFEWEGGENPVADALVSQYLEGARKAEALVAQLSKVKSPQAVVAEIREKEAEPRDERVAKFRAQIEKIDQTREKLISEVDAYIRETYVGEQNDEEVAKARDEVKRLRDSSNALVTVLEGFGVEDADLPSFPTLRGTGGGGSTGTSRPRVSMIYLNDEEVWGPEKTDKKTGEKSKSSTFSALKTLLASKHDLKVETADLQSRALEALGVTNWADAKDKDATFAIGKAVIRVVV